MCNNILDHLFFIYYTMFIDPRLDISPQTEGSSYSTFELNKTSLVTNDDHPFHPIELFVSKETTRQTKKIMSSFFNFPWLHYNQQNDSVLCFNCMKQDQQGNKQRDGFYFVWVFYMERCFGMLSVSWIVQMSQNQYHLWNSCTKLWKCSGNDKWNC